MNLFLAVVFMCLNGQCGFVYNSKPYPNYVNCFTSLASEMDTLQRRHPTGMFSGVCLEVEFSGV
jgi:hypothetical protein